MAKHGSRSAVHMGESTQLMLTKQTDYKLSKEERRRLDELSPRMWTNKGKVVEKPVKAKLVLLPKGNKDDE